MAEWKLEVAIFSEHFTEGTTRQGGRVVVIIHAVGQRKLFTSRNLSILDSTNISMFDCVKYIERCLHTLFPWV